MRDFEYCRPQSVDEAVALLAEKGEGAFPLAGGSDILLKLKRRRLDASCLVDLKAIPELQGVEREGAFWRIGALVTHNDLLHSPLVQAELPVLSRAAGHMAYPEIRNRGTVGGNICNADPAADLVPPLLALDSDVSLAGPNGHRELPLFEFMLGGKKTALRPGEILLAVKVPVIAPDTACAYERSSTRNTGGIAAASAAVLLAADRGVCREARIFVGALEDKPKPALEAAAYLAGKALADDVAREAARLSVRGLTALPDPRLSAEYRLYMAEIVVRRALREAWVEVTEKCAIA